MSKSKISIRFFNDREVRAVWDEENSKWWFSVLDVVAAINNENDYSKSRNYWKYLKTKLKKENNQLVSITNQLKLSALFLLLFLFGFIDTQAQQIEADLSYKYMFASNWDKAIQTYNFSRPFLTEKQPLPMHGINGSISYIFKSENKFKQGINASYSHFSSYAENVNFVNQYNLHFFNLGYIVRHESNGSLKGLCTDFILSVSSSALFRNVNDEPFIYDDTRSKAFGIGGDLSVRTSYSFNIKNKIRLSPFVQVGYTPYLFSPNTEAVINQTRGLVAPNFTDVFSTQVGLKVRLRD